MNIICKNCYHSFCTHQKLSHLFPVFFSISFKNTKKLKEKFMTHAKRIIKKFDPIHVVLPLNFIFPGCILVTFRSEKLLYMSTPQRLTCCLITLVDEASAYQFTGNSFGGVSIRQELKLDIVQLPLFVSHSGQRQERIYFSSNWRRQAVKISQWTMPYDTLQDSIEFAIHP